MCYDFIYGSGPYANGNGSWVTIFIQIIWLLNASGSSTTIKVEIII